MSIFKVIRVPIPTPTLYPHTTTNCYLIGNDQDCLLVDAGYDVLETRTLLEKAIKDNGLATPQRIILTHHHPDHAPGVKQLSGWSPTIYCHESEREKMVAAISPIEEISHLSDGDVISVAGETLQILHGPGHTAGHLSVYLPSSNVLIAGDNIVAEGTTWIGPPDGDMINYLHTLQRLENLKLTKIGPGHGNWVLRPYEHIDFVRNRRLHREKQIYSLLQEHKELTSAQITEFIYSDSIHPSIFQVAKKTTEAHLIKLMKEGIITVQDSIYSIVS